MLKLSPLAGPYNGLAQKIAFIKECYPNTITDTRLRRFAETAAGRGDRRTQAYNLYQALRNHLYYVADPAGYEFTKSPTVLMNQILEGGQAAGDCDDMSCIAYTMLKTIGIPSKLRVVWFDGSKMPSHIYPVAFLDGRWVAFDLSRKDGDFGRENKYSRKEDF